MKLIWSNTCRRIYAYENSHPSEPEEKWFGRLSVRIGSHFICIAESCSNSKRNCIKALIEQEADLHWYCEPGYDEDSIGRFLDSLE